MADFFKAILVLNILIVTTVSVAAALLIRRLRRVNRVTPGRRTAAPLSWLVSPLAPARLHRRLRRAVATADVSVGTIAPDAMALRDVAGELVARAVTLDDWLVAASGLHPRVRRPRLFQLTVEVREVEVSAGRLHRLSGDWRRHLDHATTAMAVPPPDLDERLDAVEAALRELPTAAPGPRWEPPQAVSAPPAATPLKP